MIGGIFLKISATSSIELAAAHAAIPFFQTSVFELIDWLCAMVVSWSILYGPSDFPFITTKYWVACGTGGGVTGGSLSGGVLFLIVNCVC